MIATTETREVTIAEKMQRRAVVACKSETQKSQKKKLGEFFTETLNYFFFGTFVAPAFLHYTIKREINIITRERKG
jgi:uncharacterized membrane protein YraQ (UPF0718 family)